MSPVGQSHTRSLLSIPSEEVTIRHSCPSFGRWFEEERILVATVWAYSQDTDGSTTLPPLPPGSCDNAVGGAIAGQAYRVGVPIDAGTDNVADWADPWPDLFHELAELKSKAGIPIRALLQSATLTGPPAAGQQREMGAIEPGKLANIVVLSRYPEADLANLRSVELTVKGGRIFERNAYVPLRETDITDR